MKKAAPLFFLIALVLCSCNGIPASTQISPKTNAEPQGSPGEDSSSVVNPTKTDLAPLLERPTESEADVRPVVVSYIQKTDQGDQIVSCSLSSQREYSPIPVVNKTHFRGPALVDDENNLYLVYGSRENYVSKLSVNGQVETKELPYRWELQMVWAGNKLFVLPLSSDNSMSVVDNHLNIKTFSPSINRLEDGTLARGTLGVPDPTASIVIWVPAQPLTDETGDYALYRTLSLESFEVNEKRLKIPDTHWHWYETDQPVPSPDERLRTIVHGVDLESENVLLCYEHLRDGDERAIYATLELYSSQDGHSIEAMECCCMREEKFDLRGEMIIESRSFPESCGSIQAINLGDLQPSFNIDSYIQPYDPSHHWLGSNGKYWLILSDDAVTVINENKQYEVSYPLPLTLPMGWVPDSTLVLAFSK